MGGWPVASAGSLGWAHQQTQEQPPQSGDSLPGPPAQGRGTFTLFLHDGRTLQNSTRTSLISLRGDTTGVSACLLPPTALHSLKQASLTVAVDSLTSRGPAGCRRHGTQAGVRELGLPLQQAQLPKERQCPPPLTTALRSPTEGISTAEKS